VAGIVGHDAIVESFRAMLARGRLASTFLFVGPPGVGKRTFALALAKTLLCQTRPAELLEPCGACSGCLQVAAGTHPDLLRVSKPADKSFIPLDLLIGPKERRMQQGLCHDISLKPFMGGRRVAVIDDADYLNEEGANSLLKTLEEPPPRSVLILIGTSPDRQLPTIRSRSQTIRFRPLAADTIASLVIEQGIVEDHQQAQRLAAASGGCLEQVRELADPAWERFRERFFAELGKGQFDSIELAKTVGAMIDEAGKEAPARRARMRLVIGFAIEWYRALVRARAGAVPSADEALNAEVSRAASSGRFLRADTGALVDRSLEALAHVDRNANQIALLECWLDDLGEIAGGSRPLSVASGR
jgi:DNA polymerase-3 subunit delta'